jgi:uncharacterized protein
VLFAAANQSDLITMIPSSTKAFSTDGPDKIFAELLLKGEFKLQCCGHCHQHVFYPRLICPHCGSQELDWVLASGLGVVYSTSVPRGMPEGEYNISLIDLNEGPRMMSRVVGIPPEQVCIGMHVQAFIGELDKTPVVLFKPLEISK